MEIVRNAGVSFTANCVVNEDVRGDNERLRDVCLLVQGIFYEIIENRFDDKLECIGGGYDLLHAEVTDNSNLRMHW